MSYSLGFMSKDEVNGVRSLEQEEYEEYKKDNKCLMDFSRKQQLFTVLKMNYNDFINLLITYYEEFPKSKVMDVPQLDKMITNLNRYIINFLSSLRMFLDHTETSLKRLYGNDSKQVKNFLGACSTAYDDHFSYRFVYKLRNYTQHCGMPIGHMQLSSKLVPETKETIHSLIINFSRDELLNNFSWGTLATEIKLLPEQFEITQHIKQTMLCVDQIHSIIVKDDLSDLEMSANRLYKLTQEMKDKKGIPCILKFTKLDETGKKLDIKINQFPLHLIETFRSK